MLLQLSNWESRKRLPYHSKPIYVSLTWRPPRWLVGGTRGTLVVRSSMYRMALTVDPGHSCKPRGPMFTFSEVTPSGVKYNTVPLSAVFVYARSKMFKEISASDKKTCRKRIQRVTWCWEDSLGVPLLDRLFKLLAFPPPPFSNASAFLSNASAQDGPGWLRSRRNLGLFFRNKDDRGHSGPILFLSIPFLIIVW